MFESNKNNRSDWDLNFPVIKVEATDFHKFPLLKRFKEIVDPPKQIFYRGNFPGAHFHFLTVVGSRNISNYGKDAVRELISGLLGQNICIISGLALGTDGEAHLQALQNNLPTIGVPGSGLGEKIIYPRANKVIADKILESGGLLLSELPPDEGSAPWTFPARNRLMAAMSDAILIIEAAEKSGSLITARLAIDYNKDVLCVPGQIFSENSKGTNQLIANGARLVQNSSDILHQFRIALDESGENPRKITDDTFSDTFTDLEKIILMDLKEPKTKDFLLQKLSEEMSCDVGEFLTAMTMLEMKGYLKEDVGVVRRVR